MRKFRYNLVMLSVQRPGGATLMISENSAHKLLHAGLVYYCPMCDFLHVARGYEMTTVNEFLEKGTY